MRYARSARPSLQRRIRAAKRKLLILDFDGTLAEIAAAPHRVVLEKKTAEALSGLNRLPAYRLAIVSGRSLGDLRSFFRLRNAVYAGNHGLEIKGRGLSLPAAAMNAKKMQKRMGQLAAILKRSMSGLSGVWIENKNYTLSVHYRNVPKNQYGTFRRRLGELKRKYSGWPIRWLNGKKIWDVRPGLNWNKGDVALYLARKYSSALPIVIGDDRTDEDMFRALKGRAITIRVGRSKRTSANFYLKDPKDVRVFLEELRAA